LAQQDNTGFAKGNNIGIKEALVDEDVEYVVLLNTDARLAESWVEEIVKFAGMKPKGAFFQGTTYDYNNHNIIDSTHIYVSRNGQGTQGGWRHYETGELGPRRVFGVNAAACMISRRFIEAQPFGYEFFDTRLFMYLEDVDVAARSTVMGWDNYLVPGAVAYHMGSVSSSSNPGFSLYMTFRNNTGVLFKNFPIGMLIRMIPSIVRGDIDTIKTLRRRGAKGAISKVIKGRLIGLFRLPFFMMKRVKLQKYKAVDNDYLWYLMRRGF
jgi:GT2 family glycosyltransferase